MTTHLTDDQLDAALRALDPTCDPVDERRKDELLRDIVRVGPRRRLWFVPVAAAAAAAAVYAGMSAGGGAPATAYASWTPVASPVTGELLTKATAGCRAQLESSNSHANPDARWDVPAMEPVVAERRGEFLFVQLADQRGSSAECLSPVSAPGESDGVTGGVLPADAAVPAAPAPDAIEDGGVGGQSGAGGYYAFSTGRVGRDVRGVVVHSSGRTVTATVANGWYVAWWPLAMDAPHDDHPSFDVTLANGTVRPDATGSAAKRASTSPTGIGELSQGGGAGGSGSVATLSGRAGAQVRSMTLHTEGGPITVPVVGGRFDAQWPDADSQAPMPRIDVTLLDGRVLTDQHPAR